MQRYSLLVDELIRRQHHMTHGEESSEKTLNDGERWVMAYVRRGSHQALPVMEGGATVSAGRSGEYRMEMAGMGGAKSRASRIRRWDVKRMSGTRRRADDQVSNRQPVQE
jgi:hypothetical protein